MSNRRIAALHIDIDIDGKLRVLGADGIGTAVLLHVSHFPEWHGTATRHRHQHLTRNGLRIASEIARVTDIDRVALPALDRGGNRLAAKRYGDRILADCRS